MEAIFMIKKGQAMEKGPILNRLFSYSKIIWACPIRGEYDLLAYAEGNRLHELQRNLYQDNNRIESIGVILPDREYQDYLRPEAAEKKSKKDVSSYFDL